MATTAPPLGKYLASTDKKTRDKAIAQLSIFLSDSSNGVLSELEMAKLWKGIFYCFWMSDKPLVQQALASEIAELILTVTSTPSSLAFLRGFWETTVREWSGIDRLRIDKYYMLVRRFVNASFRLLMRTKWDQVACNEYNSILIKPGGPLCPDDIRVPTGLAYHLSDIYVEELNKALANPPIPSPAPAPLSTLLAPFFALASRTPANTTYQRVQSALFEPLLSALTQSHSEDPPNPNGSPAYAALVSNSCMSNSHEGPMEVAELRKALLGRIFEEAGDERTRDPNRRKMYVLWKNYVDEDDNGDGIK